MSYEIPQSIQYKERIIFNLTLEQLLYAGTFGLIATILYVKLPFSIYIRSFVITIPITLGLSFMYLDLWRKLNDFWAWYRFRKAERFTNAMKRYLQLNAIFKDCYHVQTKTGEKRVAVLRVEPLNFKIKTQIEQRAIIYSFQKFLNALDFPVQFLMLTEPLNITTYLQELDTQVQTTQNQTHIMLLQAHQEHLVKTLQERQAHNRRFYITIQESDMGLDAQLNIINELLKSMKLKSERLTGKQLANTLSQFFTNNQTSPESVYAAITPEQITNEPNTICVNKKHHRIIAAVGYPRTVEEGFLDKIITTTGDFDLAIHVEPFPVENTMLLLNKELQKQRADLFAAELKHNFQPSLEIQYADTRSVLDSIQKGKEKLFNVSLYINIKANSEEELNILSKTIQSQLNSILIIPQVPKYRMAQGLKSILPFGTNTLGIRRNITTYALSAFFPFTSPFLILEKGGVFLGLNKNQLPVIKDIFSLANANGVILATSGSGKSYAAKLLLSRYLLTGTQVLVIDPQNEYGKLAADFKGSTITLSRKSPTMINPLDPLGQPEAEKRLALMDIFTFMFGTLTEPQKAILDKALSITYAKANKRKRKNDEKRIPTLHDLYKHLEKLSKKANMYERGTYTALLNRLSMYTTGVFSFLNRQTKLELNNPFTVFNIGKVPKQVKPLLMFLVLEYVYAQMKKDRQRKLLVIDEAWSLLSRSEEEGYIFEIAKTCRKWNLGLLLITQDVDDLLRSRAGRAVLSNASYALLLRQKPSAITAAEDVFHLSNPESDFLLTAPIGQGLLFMENDHQELTIIASQHEHQLITTKPNEQQEENEDDEHNEEKLDLTKTAYHKSEIKNKQQEQFALNNGYLWEKYQWIGTQRWTPTLVRPEGNQSARHTLMNYDAKKFFEKNNWSVTTVTSLQQEIAPDLICTNTKGFTVPIENETGTNLKTRKTYLPTKLQTLKEKYGCALIIVDDTKQQITYKRLAHKISPTLLVISRQSLPTWVKKLARKNAQACINSLILASTHKISRRETEAHHGKNQRNHKQEN